MSQFGHRQLEESRRRVEKAIKTNYLKTDGNWFVSLSTVSILVAFPIGFTWECLDFLFEVNLMNIFLCSVTAGIVVYASIRIIWYFTHSHRLFPVYTGLRNEKTRAITHLVFASLDYNIEETNQYFTVASKQADYRAPKERVTALFQGGTVYLHVQIVKAGDEYILQRRGPILNTIVSTINKKLT
jgi:hypothetical protein